MTKYYSPSTEGFYDSDFGYTTLPDDIIELTDDQYHYFLYNMNTNNMMIELTEDGVPTLVNRPVIITWTDIRAKRDALLASSDYTQANDWPGDAELWRVYRQQLRDIPQTFSSPESVIWPQTPR